MSNTTAAGRHRAAVANTLSMADDAAARGDYRAALEWLATVEAIGDALPADYRSKRTAWRAVQGESPRYSGSPSR
jgi:hypothetical protein